MPKKRPPPTITADRAARFVRMLRLLHAKPLSRASLLRRLQLDERGFYRDLEKLRAFGVRLETVGGSYALVDSLDEALKRLPFPDPGLNLQEAIQLSRGRTAAHSRLQTLVAKFVGDAPKPVSGA